MRSGRNAKLLCTCAPRRLRRRVAAQIEFAGYAPAVTDGDQNPLRTLDILVFQAGNFVERDDGGGGMLRPCAQAQLLQLALRCAEFSISKPDEARNHIRRLAVDVNLQLKIFLFQIGIGRRDAEEDTQWQ